FFFAGWGAGTVLLSSPLAWLHYYMLLLPGIFGAIQSTNQDNIGSGGHWVRRVVGFVPLALLSASAETLMRNNHRGEGVLVNLAVVLTMGIVAAGMWTGRERPRERVAGKGRRPSGSGRQG